MKVELDMEMTLLAWSCQDTGLMSETPWNKAPMVFCATEGFSHDCVRVGPMPGQ